MGIFTLARATFSWPSSSLTRLTPGRTVGAARPRIRVELTPQTGALAAESCPVCIRARAIRFTRPACSAAMKGPCRCETLLAVLCVLLMSPSLLAEPVPTLASGAEPEDAMVPEVPGG